MTATISVKPVTTKAELNRFVKLPWKIHAGDPLWAAPVLFDVKMRLSRKHNPYFEHAEAEYFTAYRDGEPVGRITAQIDENHDMHWGGKTGHIGWFESVNDTDVSRALFDAAGKWLSERGRDKMQGPYNFNINDECGLFIEGFDTPPMVLMTHHPPHYKRLFEDYGFEKAQDLFAYRMDATVDAPDDVKNYAETIREREGVVIRQWDLKNWRRELDKFHDVYNSAWQKNWGMVRLTEKELNAHSIELRFLLDPGLAFFAETRDGQVMGASLTLPNFNEYFTKLNGHVYNLLPFDWWGMLVKKRYKSCRVFALGVKEEFRRSGVGAVFYHDTLMAAKRRGYQWGEMSWILESNDAMNRAIRHMGAEVYKTYRIFEKDL